MTRFLAYRLSLAKNYMYVFVLSDKHTYNDTHHNAINTHLYKLHHDDFLLT